MRCGRSLVWKLVGRRRVLQDGGMSGEVALREVLLLVSMSIALLPHTKTQPTMNAKQLVGLTRTERESSRYESAEGDCASSLIPPVSRVSRSCRGSSGWAVAAKWACLDRQ